METAFDSPNLNHSLFEIDFQVTIYGLFWINAFLDAFVANLDNLCLYDLSFWQGSRLHDTKKLLGFCYISQSHFPIWNSRVELYEFFVQFNSAFYFQLSLQITPIPPRILAACQRTDYISNRETLFFLILCCANLLIFKKPDFSCSLIELISFFDYASFLILGSTQCIL